MTATKRPAKKAGAKSTAPAAPPAEPAGEPDGYSDEILLELADQIEDAPLTLELHQMDRRRRAQLSAKMAELQPAMGLLEALLKVKTPNTTQNVQIMEFLADIEDLLVTIAADPDTMRQWANGADDREMLAIFAKFVRGFTRGEASGSSR